MFPLRNTSIYLCIPPPLASLLVIHGIPGDSLEVRDVTNRAASSTSSAAGVRQLHTSAQAINLIQEWAGWDYVEERDSEVDVGCEVVSILFLMRLEPTDVKRISGPCIVHVVPQWVPKQGHRNRLSFSRSVTQSLSQCLLLPSIPKSVSLSNLCLSINFMNMTFCLGPVMEPCIQT